VEERGYHVVVLVDGEEIARADVRQIGEVVTIVKSVLEGFKYVRMRKRLSIVIEVILP